MSGTGFNNTFIFQPSFGNDVITNFDVNNDVVQFDQSTFASLADVLNHTIDSSAGAVIADAHGDSSTLVGVTVSQLQSHQNDFHPV
jgi:hypothetical protein